MSVKERLQRQLLAARKTSEALLADFNSPEEWTRQVHEGSNHALWFVGHMGVSDNFWVSLLDAEQTHEEENYQMLFGLGSQPTADPTKYPQASVVLSYMRERREKLLAILDALSDDELSRATPEGAPEFLSDFASVFESAIWHEGLHSGQLTVHRRALGHRPLGESSS